MSLTFWNRSFNSRNISFKISLFLYLPERTGISLTKSMRLEVDIISEMNVLRLGKSVMVSMSKWYQSPFERRIRARLEIIFPTKVGI